jgi:hypothetical protein
VDFDAGQAIADKCIEQSEASKSVPDLTHATIFPG